MSAMYYYFKPSGKFKYEAEGNSIPDGVNPENHVEVADINGGKMPGVRGMADNYFVVIIDPESYPRFIHPSRKTYG